MYQVFHFSFKRTVNLQLGFGSIDELSHFAGASAVVHFEPECDHLVERTALMWHDSTILHKR